MIEQGLFLFNFKGKCCFYCCTIYGPNCPCLRILISPISDLSSLCLCIQILLLTQARDTGIRWWTKKIIFTSIKANMISLYKNIEKINMSSISIWKPSMTSRYQSNNQFYNWGVGVFYYLFIVLSLPVLAYNTINI